MPRHQSLRPALGMAVGFALWGASTLALSQATVQRAPQVAVPAPVLADRQAVASACCAARPWAALGAVLGNAALAEQRGGSAVVDAAAAAALAGTVSGNQASDVNTGANTINGGAFANASGVPMVIQNSGNNVLIQSSVVVTVQLK